MYEISITFFNVCCSYTERPSLSFSRIAIPWKRNTTSFIAVSKVSSLSHNSLVFFSHIAFPFSLNTDKERHTGALSSKQRNIGKLIYLYCKLLIYYFLSSTFELISFINFDGAMQATIGIIKLASLGLRDWQIIPLGNKPALWQMWDKMHEEGWLGTSRHQFCCLDLSLFTIVRFLKISLV